jgi:hypothetical protein
LIRDRLEQAVGAIDWRGDIAETVASGSREFSTGGGGPARSASPLKNRSGGLDESARARRSQPHGGGTAAEGGEKVYRVQGGVLPNASKERFAVGEGGELSIRGDDMLYVNLGQEGRALEFLGRRGDTAVLVEFEVSSEFATTLRTTSVPQRAGRSAPGAAQRVDETRAPDQFGIPSNMFQDLLDSVVPGSVRIRKQ